MLQALRAINQRDWIVNQDALTLCLTVPFHSLYKVNPLVYVQSSN